MLETAKLNIEKNHLQEELEELNSEFKSQIDNIRLVVYFSFLVAIIYFLPDAAKYLIWLFVLQLLQILWQIGKKYRSIEALKRKINSWETVIIEAEKLRDE